MLKKNYALSLISFTLCSYSFEIQNPNSKASNREIPSLKTLTMKNLVEKVTNIEEFKKIADRTAPDLRCELVKIAIKTKKLSKTDLRKIVDIYCKDNHRIALNSYISYKFATAEREKAAADTTLRNTLLLPKIDEFDSAVTDALGYDDPIYGAVSHTSSYKNHYNVTKFLIELGEKPTTSKSLLLAVRKEDAPLVELLIEAGSPVDDSNLTLIQQPLYYAFKGKDEKIIDLLIKAGASLTKEYKIMEDRPYTRSIAEGLRRDTEEVSQLDTAEQVKERAEKNARIIRRLDKYGKK